MRSRQISPVELVDAYLERIDRLDGRLRAYITVTAEAAREAAGRAEAAVSAARRWDRCTACRSR